MGENRPRYCLFVAMSIYIPCFYYASANNVYESAKVLAYNYHLPIVATLSSSMGRLVSTLCMCKQ